MSLKIHQLTKIYGQQRAIDSISFEVKEGEIVGFLGPNGAGKSTTMKILSCYIPPSEGFAEVAGFSVMEQPIEAKKAIGYLPEHNPLYLDMYVHEYLRFIGSLHQMPNKYLKERVEEMVSKCGLTREQNKKIGALSKGYRQRVGLAQAMIHNPKVLILDEPTTGLDPNQILEIRQLIKEVSVDKTVIFSTHIMQEVEALCNRAIIINKGKIVADSSLSEIRNRKAGKVVNVEFEGDINQELLAQIVGVVSVSQQGKLFKLYVEGDKEIRPLISKLAGEQGWITLSLSQEEDSMEKVFQELTSNQ